MLSLPLLSLACTPVEDRPADGVAQRLDEIELAGDWRGVSGLSRTADGGLVAVEERGLRLLNVAGSAVEAVPVQGVPEGVDLEALAVEGQDLWLGTEAEGRRSSDRVLRAHLAEGELHVVGQHLLSYEPLGLRPKDNRGVEALCAVDGRLVAASEVTDTHGGRRRAPAWIVDPDGGQRHLWLGLSSREGKLSGLACAPDEAAGLLLWGIERHYGVRRLLQWRLGPGDSQSYLEPEATWDLDPALVEDSNPEGLALLDRHPDGSVDLAVVNDNDHGSVSGPTRIARLRLPPPP